MKKVSFAVVGVRNFAQEHIEKIQLIEKEGLGSLAAVVVQDPVRNNQYISSLRQQGVAVHLSYESLLEHGQGTVDIITLPTSIHSHYDLALRGMKAGYNLVLEKPPVPTIQQMDDLIQVEKETGTFCSVGFQMIHARTIRRLKEMIVRGDLGQIKEMTCRGYWPRNRAYYARNRWAGKTVVDGQLVMDGPIHNALAHYLNNMICLAGTRQDSSADLRWVRAELYRSRPFIEADDTSCLEAETTTGVKIYFYVTHSSPENMDPIMEIVGTKGTAQWNYSEETVVRFTDGQELRFDNEGIEPWTEVMRVAAQVHRGDIPAPYCTLQNSRSFVVAFNGAYDSAQYITPIGEESIHYQGEGDEQWTVVKDIMELMDKACAERKLLSDLDIPWARKTRRVSVENYTAFNPFGGPIREWHDEV